MRRIKKWRELQLVYMPGAAAPLFHASEDGTEDNGLETAETTPLLLPSSLDPVMRERICIERVAEHERLLRMAQLQDSLAELRRTRKIRRKLLLNHYTQVAGQGVRANTRSRAVLNSVESRIAKFVERYRVAYHALLQLDPSGDWQETYLELKDSDNRGPGKEKDEKGTGDGSYLRSWIWLPNPRVPDGADGEVGEEGASEEDVNEALRVEWTTSFARLERWSEEVELLQEEMRRVVMFLEWKSSAWLAKAEARGGSTALDVRSGLNAYAKKQAAVYHDLAVSFATFWRPTLVSYGLQHSWVTEYVKKHVVPPTDAGTPAPHVRKFSKYRQRGIFKYRLRGISKSTLSRGSGGAVSTAKAVPPDPPAAGTATYDLLEEFDCSEDSCSDDGGSDDSGSDFDDWDDDLDL